jgi:hypothetical protein
MASINRALAGTVARLPGPQMRQESTDFKGARINRNALREAECERIGRPAPISLPDSDYH